MTLAKLCSDLNYLVVVNVISLHIVLELFLQIIVSFDRHYIGLRDLLTNMDFQDRDHVASTSFWLPKDSMCVCQSV